MGSTSTSLPNVFPAVENFEQLKHCDEVMDAALNVFRPFGCDFLVVSKPRFPDTRAEDAILATRTRAEVADVYWEWLKCYSDRRYADADPLVLKMRASAKPFAWFGACRSSERNERATEIVEQRRQRGFGQGLIVPVFNGTELKGFVSIGGSEIKLDNHNWPALHLTALFTFARVFILTGPQSPSKNHLTAREREVLSWVARGRIASEVGGILNITKRTVDEHVTAACRKLNALNRAHAVAIAVRERIIEV